MMRRMGLLIALFSLLACQPQVNVVPTGPIVIQLEIRHEVRLRLDSEVREILENEAAEVVPRGVDGSGTLLAEARRHQRIGERADGYLGVVPGQEDAMLEAAVDVANEQRRRRYEALASETGTETAVVEAVAGEHRIKATPRGAPVKAASGAWTTRP